MSDVEVARAELIAHGAEVTEVFHEEEIGARFHPAGANGRLSGPASEHQSYASFASFEDPDGNGWLLQEITARLPGRIDPAQRRLRPPPSCSGALRRAEAAHGEHEARTGQADANWPDWYAEYMVREQAGQELPS